MSETRLPARPATPTGGTIAKPLAGLVARAAKSLPATTGVTARAAARPDLVILADVSASMSETAGSTRKVDALRESLASVLIDAPAASILAFASGVEAIVGTALPEPRGGTALHLALERSATYRRALVISDGEPDSAADALRVAERIVAGGTQIDTLFIGADTDARGIDFMRQLAKVGRGRPLTVDIIAQRGDRAMLSSAIRQLTLGAPK